MRVEERQVQVHATADQVLGEIRDYCRATQTAESTFGRLVVNDGKLVSRLRDGARITTGTLDKVRRGRWLGYVADENILTRRANHRQYFIIARFVKFRWSCPTTLFGAMASKKSRKNPSDN